MLAAFMMKGYKNASYTSPEGHEGPVDLCRILSIADEPPLLLSLLFLSSPPYE
jgi:hypothetical protein